MRGLSSAWRPQSLRSCLIQVCAVRDDKCRSRAYVLSVTETAPPGESVETRPDVPRRSVVRDARSALGTFALVFVLFFCTSGGPYTTETLIHKVGPGLGLLILIVVPIVWSLPEVLIVGELASMLPEEGGYYRWVDRAFGRFWAFQNGWLTWMYSLVDMAIYPVLFNQYLKHFVPGLGARLRSGPSHSS